MDIVTIEGFIQVLKAPSQPFLRVGAIAAGTANKSACEAGRKREDFSAKPLPNKMVQVRRFLSYTISPEARFRESWHGTRHHHRRHNQSYRQHR